MMNRTLRLIQMAIAETILAVTLVGCCTSDNEYQELPASAKTMQTTDFNQEQYVWQVFLFPTNRTSGKQ